MVTINIDEETCQGDGKCVKICPMQILKMNVGKPIPEYVPGGSEKCINCGHCLAICPHGSITLSTMDPREVADLDHAKFPGIDQVELFLKARRSIRNYSDEPMTKELIEKLLDIARYAPSGINRQPVNWVAIIGKDKVHDLGNFVCKWMEGLVETKSPMAESLRFDRLIEQWKKGEDLICRNAPSIVIAYGVKDDPMVPASCLIAGTYLELAAFGLGLGACWAGYVNMAINMDEKTRKFTGMSARATAGAVMMIGHPKYRFHRIPARNPAKVIWK
jgi:nitroreductase/NAD-dependent dihydropyrimidine dehydrogenase PreA subunit